MNLDDKEKQEIIDCRGNVLVTANPGTGKTFLLACKYVDLIQKGLTPEEILCLTFTNKAKSEMEERIIGLLKKEGIEIDLSKLNVFTFHSYAANKIGDSGIVSANLLRYTVFRYLKENQVLNYGDEYLLNTIVPRMENLLRYLKSFGILPKDIDSNKAKELIEETGKFSKKELDSFLEEFVKIFKEYEKAKQGRGLDYTDLLIEFLELKKIDKFKHVLIDELQDVNRIEADIALKSGETFMAVGDPKQAIFGFQGGSILNFKKFKGCNEFVLSANRRSTDQILDYAREFFSSKTSNKEYCRELEKLHSFDDSKGPKPTVIEVKENPELEAANLVKELSKKAENIAVIARTNSQIMSLSKEFSNQGITHSSTHFSASREAKQSIVSFLRGIFSSNTDLVKNAMFSPFFPIPLQKAFELAGKKNLSLNEVLEASPEFKKLRESVKGIEDIHVLFQEKIVPVALAYGKEYLYAALSIQTSCSEALSLLEDKSLESFTAFLESSDLQAQETDIEEKIVLTTIHKAKGKQFDTVVFIPKKTRSTASFQDQAVEAILKSKEINAKEELEEEGLRSDFVALTRAKKQLIVLTDRPSQYLNECAESLKPSNKPSPEPKFDELEKRAFNLFVNRDYDKAKELLESRKPWLKEFISKHFKGIERVSFSCLEDKPFDFFCNQILGLRAPSDALNLGTKVHSVAECLIKGSSFEIEPEIEPFVENVKSLLAGIKKDWPETLESEQYFRVPLSKVIETQDGMVFSGKIDCVFRKGDEYLVVDWKTSKNTNYASSCRQQLELYKRAFSVCSKIPLDKINVGIGFVGLRKTINDGKVRAELDCRQPGATAFATVSKKLQKFLEWRNNPEQFIKELLEEKCDTVLWRSLAEKLEEEKETNGVRLAGK